MKKLALALLAIALFAAPAFADTLEWDHDGNCDGFIVYYYDQGNPPANLMDVTDSKLGIIPIPNNATREYALPGTNFKADTTYAFSATAYKLNGGESARSNIVTWDGGEALQITFTPPAGRQLPVTVIVNVPSLTITAP